MDIYEAVNKVILNKMERGDFSSWVSGLKPPAKDEMNGIIYSSWNYNMFSRRPYSLINSFMLDSRAEEAGFKSKLWLTFNQVKELGGNVRGEKSKAFVVFFKLFEKEKDELDPDTGEKKKVAYPYLSYSSVFNLDQVKDLPKDKVPAVKEPVRTVYQDNELDLFINRYCSAAGVGQEYFGRQPYYSPGKDLICMPEKFSYKDSCYYYGAYLHEMTHSTGHPKRLDRFSGEKEYSYAKEELAAEIGASYLKNILGIKGDDLSNSVAYIDGWKKHILDDKYLIVSAFSKAEKACDYILERALDKKLENTNERSGRTGR